MARNVPEHLTVRMYQVGFGDCFMLSLAYPRALPDGRSERHVLVDFGSTRSPREGRLKMPDVAERIGADCGGKLDVVVVTHRHKDHLSGFASDEAAATLEGLDPDLIVRPWTEDPSAAADATGAVGARSRQLLASLAAGEQFAASLAGAIGSRSRGLRGSVRKLAEDQLRNAEAVNRLAQWAGDTKGEYLHAGMASRIGAVVPGLKVEVLGPPTVDQFPEVVHARARDPEYWMLYQGVLTTGLPVGTLDTGVRDDEDGGPDDDDAGEGAGGGDEDEEEGAAITDLERRIPAGPARWLADRLRRQQVHSLQRIVRSLDDALNNTSLVLLLEVGSRRLLLPGDAQIENWRFTLSKLPRSRALERRLREVDLYKVGHHGSRNATPRSLLALWGDERRPVSLLSTRRGVHGHTEATAVPRATLVAALREHTELHSTEGVAPGEAVVVEADATGAGGFHRTS